MRGEKWISHASLLAKVPSINIEFCERYKIPRRVGSLGLLVLGSWVHCFYLPL